MQTGTYKMQTKVKIFKTKRQKSAKLLLLVSIIMFHLREKQRN